MSKVKFQYSFQSLVNHLNTANIMESLALCRFVHIYQTLKKDNITEDLLLNDECLHETIRDNYFVKILGGEDYSCISSGYLRFTENMFHDFFKLKFALNYPNEKVATCPEPEKIKNSLLKYIKNIVQHDKDTELTYNQEVASKKYRDYVFFNIRHILSYCSQFDNDFILLGQEIFDDFNETKYKHTSHIHNLIATTLNEHFEQYKKLKIQNNNQNCYLFIEDKRIVNLYNNIVLNEPINNEIFKLKLNSHKKGQLGENLFGDLFNGEVVGYENKKTDIIENGHNVSLKTSYSNSWNHHLAYLNNEHHAPIINALKNKEAFFKIKDIDWGNIVHKLFSGNEIINELIFQKVTLDDLNKEPTNIKIWRFPISGIVDIIKNKQFIFNNHNLILFQNQEQFIKLHFKKRTNSFQVMVSIEETTLNNVINNNFGTFEEPAITKKSKFKK